MNATDASDFLNPMLVKEARQGLKSRVFGFSFLLVQGLMVVCMALQVLQRAGGARGVEETATTVLFWVCVGAPLVMILPVHAINAIYGEHRQNTLPLVLLTRLTPWRLVTGKWLSLMAQAMLIACAVLPCLVLRYFLGGVNVARDLLVLALLLGASALLCAGGLLLSTVKHPWKAFWIGLALFVVFSPLAFAVAIPLFLLFYGMSARPGLIPLQLVLAAGALLHWAAGRYASYRFHERVSPRIHSILLAIAVVACLQGAGKFAPVLVALPVLLPPLLLNLVGAAKLARPGADPVRLALLTCGAACAALVLGLLTQKLPGPGPACFFATLVSALAVPAYFLRCLRRWINPFVPMLVFAEMMLLLVGGVLLAIATDELRNIPAPLQILPVASFMITAFGRSDAGFLNLNLAIAILGILALAREALRDTSARPPDA